MNYVVAGSPTKPALLIIPAQTVLGAPNEGDPMPVVDRIAPAGCHDRLFLWWLCANTIPNGRAPSSKAMPQKELSDDPHAGAGEGPRAVMRI